MKVFITGANGFIGSHVTKAFCRNHEVTVLVRPGSKRDFIKGYRVRVIEGGLDSRELLREALRGIELLVHVAAKVSDWGEYQEFFDANVTGSLNLIDSLDRGARMIFISSTAVLGEEDCREAKDDHAPYLPNLEYFLESLIPSGMNHYRLTKTIAEQMLFQRAERDSITLTILRPTWVYGPREFNAGPFEYCKAVKNGIPYSAGTTDNLFHVIYVEDLARLVLRAGEQPPPGRSVYNCGGGEVPLMETYWSAFCRGMGLAKPRNLPKWLVYPVGLVLECLWLLFRVKTPPLFTRARVYMLYANNVYKIDKIRRDFGFNDFTPLERGVKKTLRWWRMAGYLK